MREVAWKGGSVKRVCVWGGVEVVCSSVLSQGCSLGPFTIRWNTSQLLARLPHHVTQASFGVPYFAFFFFPLVPNRQVTSIFDVQYSQLHPLFFNQTNK